MAESKQVIRTRRDISNALLKLMLKKKFEDITVIDICENALVTRATFYKYFEDKYHLVSCIIEDYKNDVILKALKDFKYTSPKELYMKIAEICIDFISDNIELFLSFIKNENDDKLRILFLQMIDESVSTVLNEQKELLNYKVPIEILSKFFTGGLAYMGTYLIHNANVYSKEKVLSYIDIIISDATKVI